MDPTPELHSEIRDRLGVLPNFFRLAPEAPEITANLWAFAKSGYLDNPLPAPFKERLFVSLSRFCSVRYCIARHVGFLLGLGKPSGDGRERFETPEQVVALLRRSLPSGEALELSLANLSASGVSAKGAPEPDTPMEAAVFDCASYVFLQTPQAERCLDSLAGYFEPAALQHLLLLLAFVRTAHFWTVVHPELEVERDIAEVLSIQEALAECVIAGPEQSSNETLRGIVDEVDALRTERQLRMELEHADDELREERERLRVTLASIGDGVITTDTDERVTNMNAVAERLTGWKKEEAEGLSLGQVVRIIHETTRATVGSPAAGALREGSVQSLANGVLLIAKDGSELPIDDSAAPIRDASGRILGCVLIFRDVTERRSKQGISELLAAIVESSEDAIISKSLDGSIQSWNAAAERLFGYSAEEAIGRSIMMLIPPELASDEVSIIARIRRGERIVNFDTVRLHRGGRRVEVSLTISPVKDATGRIIGASKVAHDISHRRKVEETLAQAACELAEADQRKDRFLAILAHELRNPLSPIRSCIQVLKAGADPGDHEPLSIMERQVNQMVRIIDDLLDVARISRGKLELRKGRVVLQEVIGQAIESVQPMVDQKAISVVVEAPDVPIELEADGARLTQVAANLLTNATKYSPAESTITVRVVPDEDSVRVSIIDEGAGIPADKIDAIFGMFVQIESPATQTQGLGIGLTMARELMELHGGELSAHSKGPGAGATFTFTLPYKSDSTPTQAPSRNHRAVVAGKTGLRVLAVDDSADSALALGLLLKLRGCTVRTAFDGPSALQTARDFRPSVIFLDIGMSGMNGLEVAAHIRSESWGRDMRIVALSGWGQAEDRERTKNAGFDEHLVKPADIEAIDRILSHAAKQVASSPNHGADSSPGREP